VPAANLPRFGRARQHLAGAFLLALLHLTAIGCSTHLPTPSIVSSRPDDESRHLAREWLASVSAFQAGILRDQEVSAAEYASALTAGKTCMETHGFRVSSLQELPDGIRRDFIVYDESTSPPPGSRMSPEMSRAWDECRREFYGAVETVWLTQHVRRDITAAGLRSEEIACLESNGVRGAQADFTDHDIVELLSKGEVRIEAWGCRERFLIYSGQTTIHPEP
jgi:hypothetical protein